MMIFNDSYNNQFNDILQQDYKKLKVLSQKYAQG